MSAARRSRWRHYTSPRCTDGETGKVHLYTVWTRPAVQKPVARAAAGMWFTYDKNGPDQDEVRPTTAPSLSYRFENHRLVHTLTVPSSVYSTKPSTAQTLTSGSLDDEGWGTTGTESMSLGHPLKRIPELIVSKLQLSNAIVSGRVLRDPDDPFVPEEQEDARTRTSSADVREPAFDSGRPFSRLWKISGPPPVQKPTNMGMKRKDSFFMKRASIYEEPKNNKSVPGRMEAFKESEDEEDDGVAQKQGSARRGSVSNSGNAILGRIAAGSRPQTPSTPAALPSAPSTAPSSAGAHAVFDSAARSHPHAGLPRFLFRRNTDTTDFWDQAGVVGPTGHARNYLPPLPARCILRREHLVSEEGVSGAEEVDVEKELRRLEVVIEKEALERKKMEGLRAEDQEMGKNVAKNEAERRGSGGRRRGPKTLDEMVEEEEEEEEAEEEEARKLEDKGGDTKVEEEVNDSNKGQETITADAVQTDSNPEIIRSSVPHEEQQPNDKLKQPTIESEEVEIAPDPQGGDLSNAEDSAEPKNTDAPLADASIVDSPTRNDITGEEDEEDGLAEQIMAEDAAEAEIVEDSVDAPEEVIAEVSEVSEAMDNSSEGEGVGNENVAAHGGAPAPDDIAEDIDVEGW
ncbi:hypothetical protein BJ742DRAFT_834149 [Cladochytrium replicatum]|nr:hypothetical protein BJ742DRAFT_834149 [Cladochytrium replicatum]